MKVSREKRKGYQESEKGKDWGSFQTKWDIKSDRLCFYANLAHYITVDALISSSESQF